MMLLSEICQPHLCAGGEFGTDSPGICARACGREEGDMRQLAWTQRVRILSEQPTGFFFFSYDVVNGPGKSC